MLPTDTDRLMYKTEAGNVYEDYYNNKELLDFSNYPKDSIYYKNSNNLVVTKVKDQTCGVPIKGFAGLKSKMWTFITKGNHEIEKAKSINKKFVDDELKYEDYKNVLFNRSFLRHEMNKIQSKDHNIGSYRINKVSLPFCDDKIHILEMDIVGYHILINLLVKHIKDNIIEYRQLVLIFGLVRKAILFSLSINVMGIYKKYQCQRYV